MSEYIILNAVPVYKEAPVSPEQMKSHMTEVLNTIVGNAADKKYMVIDKSDKALVDILENQIQSMNASEMIQIIAVDVAEGFVYGNATAVVKLLYGEKPIPSGNNVSFPVYSVEQLLNKEEKMVYVDGNAKKKGAFTFAKTITPRVILDQCGSAKEFKGMYLGYPMGQFISASQLDEEIKLTTDYITIYDESNCILDRLVAIAERYQKESCGRCVFGHEGTTQIAMILSDIAQKKGKSDDIEILLDLCNIMKDQALCDIGMAAANTVHTAISNFREEIDEHITKKICKAGVCSKFVTYHILPDLCTGCNDCQDECEDDAISGKKRFIHVIDQGECVQCGACIEACDEGAIVKASAMKPRCPKAPIPCKR